MNSKPISKTQLALIPAFYLVKNIADFVLLRGAIWFFLSPFCFHHLPHNKGEWMMTTENQTTKKSPTHTAYYLKAKEGSEKQDWIITGVAWEHGDKDGFNLSLTVLGQPVSLVVRKNKPKEV